MIYVNFLGLCIPKLQIGPMAMVTEPTVMFGRLLIKTVLLSLITCLGNQ